MKTTNNIMMYIWIAVIYSVVTALDTVQAQHASPALKPSVDIEEIRVIGEAKRGDTFEVLVRYKTLLNAEGSVTFRVPEHALLPGRSEDAKTVRETHTFSRDQIRTDRFTVQAGESGNG